MFMDCPQWRSQSEEHSAEIPELVPEPNTKRTTFSTSFPRMGSLFSLAQWQELELQAQIYKYMMVGAPVPLELIIPLKRSIVSSSSYCHYHHLQPSMFQSGYWGRCIADPEPGRCRRTDGKKWRCSKDVVEGKKYCEGHVNRGRNRSRKLVEIPTSNVSSGFKAARTSTTLSPWEEKKETHFSLSRPPATLDISPLDQRPPDGKETQGSLPQRRDGRVLMRFFDDWPSSEKHGITVNDNANSIPSSTRLSISVPENSASDFSLKLSTGNANTLSLWGNHMEEASRGGPLAEALRSSTSSPSPTSVFQKPNGSVSEASSAST